MKRRVLPPARPRASPATGLATLLGVFAGLVAVLPAAAAPTCEALHPGRVVLQAVDPRPTLDTSLDLAALRRRGQTRDAQRGQLGQPLGLTVAKLVESLEADGDFAEVDPRAPGRGVCGVATEVRVRVGFEDTVIYVAREVTGDPCLYDEVYRHEQRHVQVDRELVDQFAARIAAGLRALVARMGTMRGPSRDAVWRAIRDRLDAAVTADLATLAREMRRRQDAVDRPEEYSRISQVCGGAGGRLIAGTRRSD